MSKIKSLFLDIKKDNSWYIMLVPAIVGFIIFQYGPILYSIIIGFKNYDIVDGLMKSPWVGLKYFIQFFKDPFFFRVLKNTVLLGLYNLLWSFPFPIIVALLLNEVRKSIARRFVQTSIFLPYFISLVVLIGLMYNIFSSNGMFNTLFNNLGFGQINIISNPSFFRSLYVISEIWQQGGWGTIIYIAALSAVRQDLYDAAAIDGANRWHNMWYISISEIRPIIVFMLIWRVGNMLNISFEKVLLMYSPSTYSTSDIIQTYVYRRGILGLEYGYAGAIGFFNSVISILLLVFMNMLCKKVTDESLW